MTNPQPSEKLLDRFLAGECSPPERQQVESWIAEDSARAQRFGQLSSLLVAQNDRRDWNVDKAYADVESRIRQWNRQIDITPIHRVFIAPWARWQALAIAAVALIAIAGTLTFSSVRGDRTVASGQWNEARTGAGETREIKLADGSLVKLGPMTIVRHASNRGEVTVEMQGLAGFEVVHDPKRTFKVRAGNANVVDIGTSFIVRAYPRDSAATVVVTSGKVSLSPIRGPATGTSTAVELAPGERGMVLASGTIIGGDAIGNEISSQLAQLGGRLSFNALDMQSVAADIGNWFGVKVTIADSTLASRRITAVFTRPSLSEVLDAIAETTGSRYVNSGGTITFASGPVR